MYGNLFLEHSTEQAIYELLKYAILLQLKFIQKESKLLALTLNCYARSLRRHEHSYEDYQHYYCAKQLYKPLMSSRAA